jgi:ferric-dicitrate binding protein FerR (iron transport regulator)
MSGEARAAELVHRYLDGVLDDDGRKELEGLLNGDREARRSYVTAMKLHASLSVSLASSEAHERMMSGRAARPRRIISSWSFWVAAAACLAIAAGAVFDAARRARDEGPVAHFDAVASSVTIERPAGSETASRGMAVSADDVIRTTDNGSATIRYAGENTTVSLRGDTEISLSSTRAAKRINLSEGTIDCRVAPQPSRTPFTVVTPHARAKVVATRFSVHVGSEGTLLDVRNGKVRFEDIAGRHASVLVGAGKSAVAREGEIVLAESARALHQPVTPNIFDIPMEVRIGGYTAEPWAGSGNQYRAAPQPGPRLQSFAGTVFGPAATDEDGNLYFASPRMNRVMLVTENETIVLAGQGKRGRRGDCAASQAWFNFGHWAGADPAVVGRPLEGEGAVFVPDSGNGIIWKIHRRKKDRRMWCSRFAGGGSRKTLPIGETAPALELVLGGVQAVAADPSGNLYTSCYAGFLRISPDGTAERMPGSMPGYALDCDRAGNVYGFDTSSNAFRYSPKTGTIEQIMGRADKEKGWKDDGKDGPALGVTPFLNPGAWAVHPDGWFYSCSRNGLWLRRVREGRVATLTAGGTFEEFADNNARMASGRALPGGKRPHTFDRSGRTLYLTPGGGNQMWRMTQ